jgi:phage FluMu protein Com
MPYRDAPFVSDYRDRPYPIYTPFLPRSPAIVEPPGQPSVKQAPYIQKLTEALARIVDPGGIHPPMTIVLSIQNSAYFAEVKPPSVLPKAPASFMLRLSETSEVSRNELRMVGVVLRNGWSDYFSMLEKGRFLYRQELLTNNPELQKLLAAGLFVQCPRCGESKYTRSKQEAMKLRDLPVPLLRTKESCSNCHLARLFEEIRCRKCPGLLLPIERTYASLYDSSDPQLPIRENQRWQCQLCKDEITSTSFKPGNGE